MPYKSRAQQRFFNAVLRKQDADLVDKYNKETRGKYDSLPERIGASDIEDKPKTDEAQG